MSETTLTITITSIPRGSGLAVTEQPAMAYEELRSIINSDMIWDIETHSSDAKTTAVPPDPDHRAVMPEETTTREDPRATLTELNTRWDVLVGDRPHHARYVGGPAGCRVATDGGHIWRITDAQFEAAIAEGWGLLPGEDPWADNCKPELISTHDIAQPDQVKPMTHTMALRYGPCWLSSHYVAIAMRAGAATIGVTGALTPARVEGLCVIAPLDPEQAGGQQ